MIARVEVVFEVVPEVVLEVVEEVVFPLVEGNNKGGRGAVGGEGRLPPGK